MLVLTNLQLNEAIIRGLNAMGLIEGAPMQTLLAAPGNLRRAKSENGFIVVTFDGQLAGSSPTIPTKPAPKPNAAKPTAAQTSPSSGEPNAALAPENVKAALKTAMDHPPGITTIAKWTEEERVKAVRWTKAYAKDKTAKIPDFIVPRAPRGSKKKAAGSAPSAAAAPSTPPAPAANGAASSDAGAFFDDDTDSGAGAEA